MVGGLWGREGLLGMASPAWAVHSARKVRDSIPGGAAGISKGPEAGSWSYSQEAGDLGEKGSP